MTDPYASLYRRAVRQWVFVAIGGLSLVLGVVLVFEGTAAGWFLVAIGAFLCMLAATVLSLVHRLRHPKPDVPPSRE